MRLIAGFIFSIIIFSLLSCQSQRKLYELYKMEDFNIIAGNDFITKIKLLPNIYEISIVDTKADGNNFVVNGQNIFLDTIVQDKPNYYNYKKRASELNISPDSLLNCLKSFNTIGVNEFNLDKNYFRFPVVVGLTTNKGYIYSENINLQIKDTLPATSVKNKDFHFKVVLTKKINKNWFEYYKTY